MNLLGRARKMWQGLGPAAPPKPQYYDVACAEGHRLQGQRSESYQALRCPTCGRGIFILPLNPIPDPPPPKSKSAPASIEPIDEGPIALQDAPPIGVDDEEDVKAVEWLDPEPDGEVEPDRPIDDGFDAVIDAAAPRPGPADRHRSRPSRPAETATPPARPVQAERPNGIDLAQSMAASAARRARRRRPVLILAGVIAIVAATTAYRAWRINLQNLPQQAEEDLAAGRKALENGDFANAKFKLGEAARALERLGADSASETRQAASEAAILADLIGVSIEEMLQEAARSKTPEDWASLFRRQYLGQAILIEDELAAREEGSEAPFSLTYRILSGAKPAVGRIDLTGLKLFEGKAYKVGTRVTFGARLASVELLPDGRWRIGLEPESGVVITDFKPLSFLGWGMGESGPAEGANP